MPIILLVENDPLVSFVAVEAFRSAMWTEARWAQDDQQALRLIATEPFDFAFISVMRNFSGLIVAERAANANIAVLLTSGNPFAQDRLQRCGCPYLEKPYDLSSLLVEARRILADSAGNIRLMKASVSRLMAPVEALRGCAWN